MLLISLLLYAAQSMAWDLTDVSVLTPLPKNITETSKLMGLTASGRGGSMVPSNIVAQLPVLVFNQDKNKTYLSDLRAVSFRFDPCFGEGTGHVPCRKQVRISWQPLFGSGAKVTTFDAALHSFYEFDEAAFKSLIIEYRALLLAHPSPKVSRLEVNPRLVREGIDGPFARGFAALIRKHCGSENLSRVTVMTLGKGNQEWKFRGWHIVNGRMNPITIAVVRAPEQEVKTTTPKGFDLLASAMPAGFSPNAVEIYRDSLTARGKLNDQRFQDFAREILETENPNRSNPGTVDCAACHMSGPGGQWARLNFAAWDWPALILKSGFSTARDVTNVTLPALRPRRFRAFGYFGSEALISQRTINESAVVADQLEQMFPASAP